MGFFKDIFTGTGDTVRKEAPIPTPATDALVQPLNQALKGGGFDVVAEGRDLGRQRAALGERFAESKINARRLGFRLFQQGDEAPREAVSAGLNRARNLESERINRSAGPRRFEERLTAQNLAIGQAGVELSQNFNLSRIQSGSDLRRLAAPDFRENFIGQLSSLGGDITGALQTRSQLRGNNRGIANEPGISGGYQFGGNLDAQGNYSNSAGTQFYSLADQLSRRR